MTPSPIHDRIRKLLALAGDASAGEAETAAAMAARLMAEHGVTLADVAASTERARPSIGCRTLDVSSALWEAMLVNAVARACGGRVVRLSRGRDVQLAVYGPEATLDALLDLAAYIRLQILREAAREAQRARPERVRSWKRSFMVGAIARVGERLAEQRRDVAASSSRAGTALALLDGAVDREVEARHPSRRRTTITVGHGYDDGRAAADRLDVGQPKVGSRPAPSLTT